MEDDRQRIHVIEIIPPRQQGGGAQSGHAQQPGYTPGMGQKPLSPFLRSAILVAVIGAGLGLLALLVAFAATIALIAVPAAIVAGLAAWIGMRWRAWRGG
ncbi:MAG: hypothetical protein MUC89_03115 [Acetobacteraceae bacterium]|nr:hypothetical protein [Acetobacteraceae bacterium]